MMSKLSSAAQAVLDAYRDADIDDAVNSAAVLRAAADHLCLCWSEELSHPADVLNNIANELDPQ
jgi:hypothetical protein